MLGEAVKNLENSDEKPRHHEPRKDVHPATHSEPVSETRPSFPCRTPGEGADQQEFGEVQVDLRHTYVGPRASYDEVANAGDNREPDYL